ncbi:MAG: copper resistance protein NlpE [Bacteroidetes bacterium]|nr:copper resistance protein NlpE [Bacteroidota bacterium]
MKIIMKKLWILVAATGILCSCGSNGSKMDTETEMQMYIVDMRNARTSLDYEGIYTGNLPTASGIGMIVTITLDKDSYVKSTKYAGVQVVYEEKGNYTWDTEGNIIILNGIVDSPNQYFVAENVIIQLDMSGNVITGELADMYILHKKF